MKILIAEIYDGYNQDSTYVLVYKNPQGEEINSLGNYLRGVIDEVGNLYVWDKPKDFLHDAAKQQFNIPNGLDIIVSLAGMVIINNNYTMEQLISMMKNARTNLSFLADTIAVNIQNKNRNDINRSLSDEMGTLGDIYQFNVSKVASKKSRLSKKNNNNQQIADYIYNNASEWLNIFTNEAANYIKKLLKNKHYIDLEEFFNDDYDVEEVMKNTLKNIRDIFDGVFDVFYGNPSQRSDENYYKMIDQVKDIINNFDSYGYDIKNLLNEKLKNALKS